MKKYFCYGKKDFCENADLCIECPHFACAGGEYREAPMTNAQKIRSMSDEALKDWYCKNRDCGDCDFCRPFGCAFKDWLQKPYREEDKHEAD